MRSSALPSRFKYLLAATTLSILAACGGGGDEPFVSFNPSRVDVTYQTQTTDKPTKEISFKVAMSFASAIGDDVSIYLLPTSTTPANGIPEFYGRNESEFYELPAGSADSKMLGSENRISPTSTEFTMLFNSVATPGVYEGTFSLIMCKKEKPCTANDPATNAVPGVQLPYQVRVTASQN